MANSSSPALSAIIPERLSLLPTALLQQCLLHVLAAAEDAELIDSGPRLGGLTFQGASAVAGKRSIEIRLFRF